MTVKGFIVNNSKDQKNLFSKLVIATVEAIEPRSFRIEVDSIEFSRFAIRTEITYLHQGYIRK